MSLTIVEAAKIAANNGEDKKAGVIMTFAESSPLLRAMPVIGINGNSYAYVREGVLPAVGFRAVNQAYTESTGQTETRTEVLKLIGGDLDVDRFLVSTNGTNVRTTHERMKATSLAQTIGLKLIKGDTQTDPLEFDGIQTRTGGIDPTDTAQTVDMNGAVLSMKVLDEAVDLVDSSIGQKVLVMSQAMRRNIGTYLRSSGTAVEMSRDQFGQPLMSYNGMPILIADQNGDQAALGFNEGAGTETSIYCCALGPSGLHMIQSGGIDVRDLGELDTSPVFRTRVEWYTGLVDEHPRCISRLYGIINGTAVA